MGGEESSREGTITNVTCGVLGAWPRVVAGEVKASSGQTQRWTADLGVWWRQEEGPC